MTEKLTFGQTALVYLGLIATFAGTPIAMTKISHWSDKSEYISFYERVEKSKELKMDSCSTKLLEMSYYMDPEHKLFYRKSDSLFLEAKEKYSSCKDCLKTIDSIMREEHKQRQLDQFMNRPFWGQVGY